MAPSQSAPGRSTPDRETPDPAGAKSGGDWPEPSGQTAAPRRNRDTERAPAPNTVLEPGVIIGDRYRLDDLLGEGGMGKVFRAEHIHMRKQVAVKVLHNDVSTTPEVVARFEREAIAAGNISHPHVAQATDSGRLEDGSFFLVLEYVAGRDLRSLIKKGPVPAARALRIIAQIASAASAAHAAGVIHRDLKPENIMLVDRDGDPDFVKVLDFGIAKIDSVGLIDDEERKGGRAETPTSGPQPLTRLGAVFGTPDYMSPEQALGQPIDARADIYSIGIILYELLAGERPFRGGAVSMMRKHVLQNAPPLPPAVAEGVDPRIGDVMKKLLEKSPQDRYASAAELEVVVNDLATDLAHGSPEGARLRSDAALKAVAAAGVVTTGDLPVLAGAHARKSRTGLWVLLAVVACGGVGWASLGGRSPFGGKTEAVAPVLAAPLATAEPAANVAPVAPSAAPSSAAATAASAASVAPSAAPSSVASAAPEASASAAADDTVVEEIEEVADGGSAPLVASRPGPHIHRGPSHAPAHAGAPRHKPQPAPLPAALAPATAPHPAPRPQPAPKHTGPGGIYVPPPSQWFK